MDLTFKAVCLNLSSGRECAQIRLNRHNTGRCSVNVRNINVLRWASRGPKHFWVPTLRILL